MRLYDTVHICFYVRMFRYMVLGMGSLVQRIGYSMVGDIFRILLVEYYLFYFPPFVIFESTHRCDVQLGFRYVIQMLGILLYVFSALFTLDCETVYIAFVIWAVLFVELILVLT